MSVDAVIGLGASLGDRAATLRLAVALLAASDGVELVGLSRLYETVPEGAANAAFLNGAVRVRTRRSPRGLLALLKQIEGRLGRRPARRWADRAVDLDLLLMGDLIRTGAALVLPHPRLHLRRFAWEPAVEVAPDHVHPVLGRPLGRLPMPAGASPRPHSTLLPRQALARDVHATLPMGPPGTAMMFFLDNPGARELCSARRMPGFVGARLDAPAVLADPAALAALCDAADAPVIVAIPSGPALTERASALARVHEQVVVELPADAAGLGAARALVASGVDVALRASPHPALARLAARVGCSWITVDPGDLPAATDAMADLWPRATRLLSRGPGAHAQLRAAAELPDAVCA